MDNLRNTRCPIHGNTVDSSKAIVGIQIIGKLWCWVVKGISNVCYRYFIISLMHDVNNCISAYPHHIN